MKTIQRAFCAMMALALCLGFAGCDALPSVLRPDAKWAEGAETTPAAAAPGWSDPEKPADQEWSDPEKPVDQEWRDPENPAQQEFELLRLTSTTVTRQESGESTATQVPEFDENGLVTALTVRSGGGEQRIPVIYTRNEQGDPSGFSVQSEDDPFSVVIENRYENGKLAEAVISDFILNGESVQTSGALDDPSSALLSAVSSAMQYLQRYVGYRDCTLRVAGTSDEIRFENGRIVYSRMDYSDIVQETVTDYGGDGSVRVTQNNYLYGGTVLQSGTTTLTDAEHFEREISFSNETGEVVRISYRYEEGTDPETGAKQLTAYFDEISYSEDAAAEDAGEVEEELEQMRGMPIARYILNEDGKVIRQEQTEEYRQLQGGAKTTVWYDDAGRITKQELSIQLGGLSEITVTTEYEYRS